MKTREIITVAVLLLLGLGVRLLISNNPGFAADVMQHKSWAESLYDHGLSSFYDNTRSNLPPMFIYLLYLMSFPMEKFPDYAFMFLKLPGMIVDVLISITIYIAVKRKFNTSEVINNAPIICMSLFLFNPAVIFDSAVWGKWDDALVSFFLLLTVCYYNTYKVGGFYVLAIYSKLQGLIFAPILFRVSNLHRVIIPLVITAAVLLIPLREQLVAMYYYVKGSFDLFPHTTVNAYNFWWLLNWNNWTLDWWHSPLDTDVYFITTPKYYGILVYLLIAALLNIFLRKYRYNFRSLCFASFFIYLTFFMFFTRMHERYMYYTLPFLALLAALANNRKYLYVYILLSMTVFLNIYIIYEQNYPLVFQGLHEIAALTIGIALVNLVVFFYMLFELLRDLYTSKWQKTRYKIFGFAIPQITENR